MRKTTKLIERGYRGLQDYRHTSTFFLRFLHFFENPKVVTFYVFCRASYVFSNYAVICLKFLYLEQIEEFMTVSQILDIKTFVPTAAATSKQPTIR